MYMKGNTILTVHHIIFSRIQSSNNVVCQQLLKFQVSYNTLNIRRQLFSIFDTTYIETFSIDISISTLNLIGSYKSNNAGLL